MTEPEKYDVLVLGSGTGGKLIAWTMASEGKRAASIERKYVGGAVSKYRLSAEQKRHSLSKSGLAIWATPGIWDRNWTVHRQHGRSLRPKEKNGGRPDESSSRAIPDIGS